MIANYLIYLYTLPKEKQITEIFIIFTFISISFIVCSLFIFIKSKIMNKHFSKRTLS